MTMTNVAKQSAVAQHSDTGRPFTPSISLMDTSGQMQKRLFRCLAGLKHCSQEQLLVEKSRLLQRQAYPGIRRQDSQQLMFWLSIVEAELRMRRYTDGANKLQNYTRLGERNQREPNSIR